MTTYTATNDGILRCVCDSVELMLSRCAEVQAFLGVTPADEAAALAAIKQNADANPADNEEFTDAQLVATRPYVVVYGDPESGMLVITDAVGSFDAGESVIVVQLQRAATTQEQTAPALGITNMQRQLGRVVNELYQQVWLEGATAIERINIRGPMEVSEDEDTDRGRALIGMLEIHFGRGGQ